MGCGRRGFCAFTDTSPAAALAGRLAGRDPAFCVGVLRELDIGHIMTDRSVSVNTDRNGPSFQLTINIQLAADAAAGSGKVQEISAMSPQPITHQYAELRSVRIMSCLSAPAAHRLIGQPLELSCKWMSKSHLTLRHH